MKYSLASPRGAGLSALLLAGLLFGQAAAASDLLQIYRLAQDNDAEFSAARADYRAAVEAQPQARSAILPQINLSAGYFEERVEDLDENESRDITREQISLSLRQTVFNWDQFAGLDQAGAVVAQAESELASASQNLILRVADHYFDVLSATEVLRFATAELEAIERQLEQAQERFEVGLIPITDVKEAQASYDLAVAREISARNELDDAREALRTVVGQAVGELKPLYRLPLDPADPDDPEVWVETAIEQNPDYLAARFSSEAARQGIRRARAGHYPTVDLVASRTRQDLDNDDDPLDPFSRSEETDSIGIELNLPLFAGGGTSSRTREARSQFEASQSRMIQARRATEQSTRNAWRGLQASISQVRALEQAVESNQAAVEATEAGFQVGTRTAVDVLNALRDLYRTEADLAEARYNYILNHLRLKQAAGSLTEEDLRLVNTWLAYPEDT